MPIQNLLKSVTTSVCPLTSANGKGQRGVRTLLVCSILLGMLSTLASTLTVAATDPAFVEVAVNGQSTEEEAAALRVGLRIVLLRLASANQPLSPAAVRRAEEEAASFVQQRSYRIPGAEDRITRQTPLTDRVRETGQATHLLSIQYSREIINQLILAESETGDDDDAAEEAIDPRSALVWLLVVDGNQRVVVGGNSAANIMRRAREIGGGFGQQLQFPVWDDSEKQQMGGVDLRTAEMSTILAASQRYRESVVLVGTLVRERGRNWNGVWRRFQGQSETQSAFESASLDQALQTGIRWLAGSGNLSTVGDPALSTRAAARQLGNEGLIWIGSVTDTRAYARVIELVDNLEGATVYLKSMLQDSLVVAVTPRTAVTDVARALIASNRVVNAGSAPQLGTGLRPDVALQYTR
ncbi:MAG: DUF2066 domain-containing protein [Gammaproteobacteria bacterium]|nr:DUF2066 domain-containing protein [Gammaproteobacteria bacterium]